MPGHRLAGVRAETLGNVVRELHHPLHHRVVLRAAVALDPAAVQRVRGRRTLEQFLADFRVDPVAGKDGGEPFVEGLRMDLREEIAGVGAVGGRRLAGEELVPGAAEFGDELAELLPLAPDGFHRVAAERLGDVRVRSLSPQDGYRPRELVQVERILEHVEAEDLPVEGSVREPVEEGMAEDVPVDRVDPGPEPGGERVFARCGHDREMLVVAIRTPPAPRRRRTGR